MNNQYALCYHVHLDQWLYNKKLLEIALAMLIEFSVETGISIDQLIKAEYAKTIASDKKGDGPPSAASHREYDRLEKSRVTRRASYSDTCDVTAATKQDSRFTSFTGIGSVNKRRRLHHTTFCLSEPMPENHVAYVTRRASTEPRDSRIDGGERGTLERVQRWGAAREGEKRSVSKQCGHLAELSRKPTAEQWGTVTR